MSSARENRFSGILEEIEAALNAGGDRDEKLMRVCEILSSRVRYYNWVGFYLVDTEKERELVLGPFVGEPTEHVRIPFGSGICGQAAELRKVFVVQDVSREENYLACSLKVKAEIVVPIFKDGKIVGELDIDSHEKRPFTGKDRKFLETIASMVAEIV